MTIFIVKYIYLLYYLTYKYGDVLSCWMTVAKKNKKKETALLHFSDTV